MLSARIVERLCKSRKNELTVRWTRWNLNCDGDVPSDLGKRKQLEQVASNDPRGVDLGQLSKYNLALRVVIRRHS